MDTQPLSSNRFRAEIIHSRYQYYLSTSCTRGPLGPHIPVTCSWGTLTKSAFFITSQSCFSSLHFSSFFFSFLSFSLSLCFLDFFLVFTYELQLCLLVWGQSVDKGWVSLSAVSGLSQSLPLWVRSLLTSERGSWGLGSSNTGRLELELTDSGTAGGRTGAGASFPLEEFSFPLKVGWVLWAKCEILGFLLARGSINSRGWDRFWGGKKKKFKSWGQNFGCCYH